MVVQQEEEIRLVEVVQQENSCLVELAGASTEQAPIDVEDPEQRKAFLAADLSNIESKCQATELQNQTTTTTAAADEAAPAKVRKYATAEYWDNRYTISGDQCYDWHHTYDGLSPLLQHVLEPEHRVLVLGCGNSPFSEELYQAGYHNIVNIDISSVCIEKMAERNSAAGRSMEWLTMDVSELQFEDNSFDLVIDKATGDSIVCMDDGIGMVRRMLSESCRVLKKKGVFVMVSVQDRVQEMVRVEELNWKVGEMKIPTALYNRNHALGADEVTFILARKKAEVTMTKKDAVFWAKVVQRCEQKKAEREGVEEADAAAVEAHAGVNSAFEERDDMRAKMNKRLLFVLKGGGTSHNKLEYLCTQGDKLCNLNNAVPPETGAKVVTGLSELVTTAATELAQEPNRSLAQLLLDAVGPSKDAGFMNCAGLANGWLFEHGLSEEAKAAVMNVHASQWGGSGPDK